MEDSFERRSFLTNMDALLANQDREVVLKTSRELHIQLENLSRERGLTNMQAALQLVLPVVTGKPGPWVYRIGEEGCRDWWLHGLTMAQLLADLELPLSAQELDRALSCAVCHILREILILEDARAELNAMFPLDPAVWDSAILLTDDTGWTEEAREEYYGAVLQDLSTLLCKLSGRGDVVSRLTLLPLEESMRYARETRKYFMPLCIRARELYPALGGPIGILLGKLRCLVTVADILDQRFAGQEKELEAEILELEEDNARLRDMLRQLKE